MDCINYDIENKNNDNYKNRLSTYKNQIQMILDKNISEREAE